MVWFGFIIVLAAFVVFVHATEKVKFGEAEETVWWLYSLGIFQWGQALIISIFWMVFGVMCVLGWSPTQAINAYVLFHVVRALVELFLISQGDYCGTAKIILPKSSQVTYKLRIQLYTIWQGLIIVGGLMVFLK